MPIRQTIQVAAPPTAPLMLYDGDCNFCKFWIIRWQHATAGRVEYLAAQDPRVAAQFPELPRERFGESIQLIETDGWVYDGAEAVFRSLTYARFRSWPLWLYQNVPGVQPVTECAYRFVAKRRETFSFLTRALSGRAGALPGHGLTAWVFLRLMGLIYLCAFLSLGSQITGLAGSNGIEPAKQYMQAVQSQFDQHHVGGERYNELPTLCWFSTSDAFLKFLCAAGTVLALAVVANLASAPCLFLLWAIYLSLSCVCGVFLSFQWDILLLETGLLAVFLAPLQIFSTPANAAPPSKTILWLLRWLLFRLMFESGLVKLLSYDPAHGYTAWHDLTALNYHYETQPLPTWIGWWAHQLPGDIQKTCVVLMFGIELVVPFLIFAPRRLRFLGAALLALLQVCILLTGNYCFFNYLTLALCLLLLDDAALARWIPARWRERILPVESKLFAATPPKTEGKALQEITVPAEPMQSTPRRHWPLGITAALAIVIISLSGVGLLGQLGIVRSWPRWLARPLGMMYECVGPLRSVNSYGLFAVMTTNRLEIVVEGSNDGQTWLPYGFKYKPGDLKQRPGFVAPHQPRLDWQMWFAALGNYQQNPWFLNFCVRLLQGSPEVLALLERNPFPNAPPRYVRARVYEYHFSTPAERRAQGVWWRREFKGEYLPAFSLKDLQ